jgi:flagellar assembly factor FliW
MTFVTAHFGPVPADDSAAIVFLAGLPGFEDCRRFTMLNHGEQPSLIFLQSLERPELCFLAVPALLLRGDYELAVSEEDLAMLGFRAGSQPNPRDEALALAILSLTEGEPPTVNLLAPVIVNPATRRAVQAIRVDGRYSCREPFLAEEPVCS